MPVTTAEEVLAAARAGDTEAFHTLVAPHLRALHLHSYRMLGSYTDAEEAVQEATLRAWRGLGSYQGTGPLRHWLYRITTTTCLKMINRRRRDPLTDTADVAWLQPYPDALLDELPATDADPAAIAERRESVALAFIAALQLLPATQRATLILREVLGWPAREVADLLGTTVAGVNSALQRARATLASAAPSADTARDPLDKRQQRLLDAFLRAWHACDIPALAALLRDDVTLTMPPQAIRLLGRDAVAGFYTALMSANREYHLVPTRANGQPAFGTYLRAPTDGIRHGTGLLVLTLAGDRISAVTRFDNSVLPWFGLPRSLPSH